MSSFTSCKLPTEVIEHIIEHVIKESQAELLSNQKRDDWKYEYTPYTHTVKSLLTANHETRASTVRLLNILQHELIGDMHLCYLLEAVEYGENSSHIASVMHQNLGNGLKRWTPTCHCVIEISHIDRNDQCSYYWDTSAVQSWLSLLNKDLVVEISFGSDNVKWLR